MHSWGSWAGTLTIRELALGQRHPQGMSQTADGNTPPPPAFLWKRPICWPWSFGLRGKPLVWHSRGLLEWPAGMEAICVFSLCLTLVASICQKGAGTRAWHLNFCDRLPGDTLSCLALVTSRTHACGSHKAITNRERVLNQLPSPGHSRVVTVFL